MSTIIDVAHSAGVSIADVSLTMNDPDTRRVSEKTKQRILKVASDLRYTPNRHAKALLNKRTNVLGLVLPMRPPLAINEFIAEAISGIQDACSRHGYNLMLYPHTSQTGRITAAELHGSHFADGLIFMHTPALPDLLYQ
jgi:LacI family transcriptional regulator